MNYLEAIERETAAREIVDKIRAAARRHGWAIGVHGTLKRDIDLIGVPWIEEAVKWHELWVLLSVELEMKRGNCNKKPHGRVGCILIQKDAVMIAPAPDAIWWPQAIDLSLMTFEVK